MKTEELGLPPLLPLPPGIAIKEEKPAIAHEQKEGEESNAETEKRTRVKVKAPSVAPLASMVSGNESTRTTPRFEDLVSERAPSVLVQFNSNFAPAPRSTPPGHTLDRLRAGKTDPLSTTDTGKQDDKDESAEHSDAPATLESILVSSRTKREEVLLEALHAREQTPKETTIQVLVFFEILSEFLDQSSSTATPAIDVFTRVPIYQVRQSTIEQLQRSHQHASQLLHH
ncbi:hypothetical protein B0A49_08780 [Cryomyces minteri]|uniref:Uncharacterized protein n=1 Tax=Cryomyces minteri TaxID=331657 RepID=A0A4U0WMZ9_9PEZI|nr:hypothetical protein B0A49_08780 [Cryomyces minteri]